MSRYLQIGEDNIERLYVKTGDSIADVWQLIGGTQRMQIAVVVDDDLHFLGIITAYDIDKIIDSRRYETAMALTVKECYNRNPVSISKTDFLLHKSNGTSPFENLKVRNLIVLDGNKCYAVIREIRAGTVVDVVDACNLRCPTCCRGAGYMQNTASKMNPDMFEGVIAKAYSCGYKRLDLYNWTEPFLCDDLTRYIEIAAGYGMVPHISTNLSLPVIKNLESVLYTSCGLMVSVSGFTKEIHQINHRNSDIEIVKKHLKYISDCYVKKGYDRKVKVKYLIFDYNAHEIAPFRDFVNSLPGVCFTTFPGAGNPQADRKVHKRNPKQYRHRTVEMMDTPNDTVCRLFYDMPIDCNGYVYLCCGRPATPQFKLGHYLDDSPDDILLRRAHHPECKGCTAIDKIHTMPLPI